MYDLTQPKIIKYLCSKYGFTFSKGLGQNFITDPSVLMEIASEAVNGAEGVIEIGPGFGSLTAALAVKAKKVTAIELDKRLSPVLAETLAGFGNIEIIWQDCLKTDINALLSEKYPDMEVSVAANLPYYITTPILMSLIENRYPFKRIIVMVQKEVARRLCAESGSKDYGAVTVTTQYFTRPKLLLTVPASAFFPQPKVDSAVVSMEVRSVPAASPKDEGLFFALVKAAFAQRRKTLANSLYSAGKFGGKELIKEGLRAIGRDENVRGEALNIQEFSNLSDFFVENVENGK